MRPTDSPVPRGATGSAQKDKAGEGLWGGAQVRPSSASILGAPHP